MDPKGATVPVHQPATFLERGVHLPSTTPLLAGTRVRRGEQGLEFVVPNPAGGRGLYILEWSGVQDLTHPTLHDVLLHDALRKAWPIAPQTVRAAARQVALDGAAGREAQAAALRAETADTEAQRATRCQLAARMDKKDASAADVDALAGSLSALGLDAEAAQARVPALLARLETLRTELQAWAGQHGDETGAVAVILAASHLATYGGAKLLTDARAQAQDIGALLAGWRPNPGNPSLAINRPAWILDGWELPCLIWQQVDTLPKQQAALIEICHILPVLPLEAGRWIGLSVSSAIDLELRRTISANKDWRTGIAALDRVQRNERLRAMAA